MTRAALLDATERLLIRYGYRRTAVDDIAQEARLSRRTFYLHFRNKEEVMLASIDRWIDRLVEQLRQEARDVARPAGERLRRMLIGRVLFLFDQAQPYEHTYDEMMAAIRTAYMPRRAGYLQAEAAILANVLKAGVERGELRVDDPSAMAHTLLLATNALMPFSLSAEQRRDRERVETEIARIADVLLRGLRAAPDTP